MKLTMYRMIGWRTSCLRGFVVIFGLIAVATIFAQESKPAADQADLAQDSPASKKQVRDQQEAGTAAVPDISGKWRYDVTRVVVGEKGDKPVISTATAVISRVDASKTEFIVVETVGTVQSKWHVKWVPQKRQYEGASASDGNIVTITTLTLQPQADGKSIQATFQWSEQIKEIARRHGVTNQQLEKLQSRELRRADPSEIAQSDNELNDPRQADLSKDANNAQMPDITGTWSRAKDGTFSKLKVWPVRNRETMFFVECPEGDGLLEWRTEWSRYVGYFTFDAVGVRTAQMYVAYDRSTDTNRLTIVPFQDQRKQLLRSGFAKTDRELDTKLSSEWNRAEAPAQPMPMMTVAVVKTQLEPHRVRDSVRSRVPYRVFSNDTLKSVIVIAPADAQDEIEALIHQLDVDEPEKSGATLNARSATPANNQSGSGGKPTAELTPLGLPSPHELPREQPVAAPLRQLNSPEARKLSESIAEHEAKARLIADEIRSLSKTLGTTHPKVIESQRQLNETLASALAAKFKLEQLQITALEENLAKLKSQVSQRQAVSKQIVERHAKELLSDPVVEWSPEKTPYKKAGEGAASHGDSAKTSLPTPQEIDAQLEPIARRVNSAASRVRTLETQYLRDRSSAVELTQALKDLQQARSEWSKQVKRIEPSLNLMFHKYETAKLLAETLNKRLESVANQLAEGKATVAEVNAVAEEHKRASESFVSADALFESYQTGSELYEDIHTSDAEVPKCQEPILNARTVPEHDPDVALAWLEAATGLKLEFIRFDNLQLWFKAALRVREAGGKHRAGDLIVTLNEHRFDSLDQATEALSRKSRGNFMTIVLRGGLAGHREQAHFNGEPLIRYLRPGDPVEKPNGNAATIPFEVRVRGETTGGLRTEYLLGTCVAPDGLVVIPVLSKLLVPGEPLIPYGKIRGTARVVATDDAHGLTLVKLESPNQPLFHWWKCHMGSPAKQQRLNCQDEDGKQYDVLVSEIGQALTKPLVGNDAFMITGPSVWNFTPGLALKTVDQELQGITIAAELAPVERKPQDDDPGNRKLAIPAVHIDKLIKDHRKASRANSDQNQEGSSGN